MINQRYIDIVQTLHGYVVVDTCYSAIAKGWETMVFDCDYSGKVTNWNGRDCNQYDDQEQAEVGHQTMVEKWRIK